jgi:proline dehydrogenase
MLQALSRGFFHTLARSTTLKKLASRYGLRRHDSFARRFIAGETVDEAIAAARAVERRGLQVTLDCLGESVATLDEATAATKVYLEVIARVAASDVGRNLSLKLTQLGLALDRATCTDNLRRILDAAQPRDFFIRVDMEGSQYTESTLALFERVWDLGYRNLGAVLQAYLRRSEDDLDRLVGLGARVRLVKGAYQEPRSIAYHKTSDVDAAFIRMMQALLERGVYPAIATHDDALIDETRRFAAERSVAPDRFEFQMLFGVRRDLQHRLAQHGYRCRIYIPFGREWFPYFMRRLGERPENVAFVMKAILRDRDAAS